MKARSLKKNTTARIALGIVDDKRKYKLDSTAIGFSLLSNKRVTNVFRISCTLKEEVELTKLQTALSTILPRFPYFRVSIRNGLFWGKFVTNLSIPEIQPESQYPCQYISFGRKKNLYRIIVNENQIVLECHHCLTDGYGALIFLNSLVAEYFRIIGFATDDWKGIFLPKDKVHPQEYEDAYERHHDNDIVVKIPKSSEKSFNIPTKVESAGVFHISKKVVSLESIKQKSKEFNVSITALLGAIYFESLRELQEKLYKDKTRKLKPIRMRIPVNLRRFLETKSMRNFILAVRLNFDPRKDPKSLRERAVEINNLMNDSIQLDIFHYKMARNIRTSNMLIMRIIPFQIKRFFARYGYYFISAPYYSGVVSNLGKITVPDQLVKHIDSYDFSVGPSTVNKERVSVISFEDKLVLTFSRVIKDSLLTEMFIKRLEELGIEIKKS